MSDQDSLAKLVIYTLSLAAIVFLFWLIYFKSPIDPNINYPTWINHLSTMNAFFNFCSATCLSFGYFHIKRKNIELHKKFMKMAFLFSSLFLVSYILYHNFHGDSKFQGVGLIRPIYFFILISHILLSIIALPMVLLTFYFALKNNFVAHRKIARFTFPIWLYVSVTGVLVYFLLKFSL